MRTTERLFCSNLLGALRMFAHSFHLIIAIENNSQIFHSLSLEIPPKTKYFYYINTLAIFSSRVVAT